MTIYSSGKNVTNNLTLSLNGQCNSNINIHQNANTFSTSSLCVTAPTLTKMIA